MVLRRRVSWTLALALAILAAAPAAGQPQVPTEEELDRRLRGEPKEERPDYQRRSVQRFGRDSQRGFSWVKHQLRSLDITPPKVLIVLGLLGVLFTWNKNKRKRSWMLLAGLSYLLVLAGAAGMYYGWFR
jgi:hypothetical protein